MSAVEVESHLEQGKKLLASGQLSDALVHYHAAVGKSKCLELEFCLMSKQFDVEPVLKYFKVHNRFGQWPY